MRRKKETEEGKIRMTKLERKEVMDSMGEDDTDAL